MKRPEDDLPPTQTGFLRPRRGDQPAGPSDSSDAAGSAEPTVAAGETVGPVDSELPIDEADPLRDPDLDAIESLGRFRIERFLGAGGMGKVFRAFDRKLERRVALKVLTLADPAATRRFVAEARAQARVDHPNVCQVFDAGEVRGRQFIVMQLLEGRTLALAAEELPIEAKVALVRQACDGVHAAHRIGLVHRDLKASNILVVETETGLHPYVLDFGLAREVDAAEATRTVGAVGTPRYMPPEQVAGDAVDRRSDVYSLGVLLYRLLGDRYPIEGKSELDILMKVLTEDPAPLRQVAPAVPADLETVVMKCLERDPARRYDSARALADDLGRWLAGDPVAARPASAGYRFTKWVRKHRTLVAAGTLATLAIAAAAGFALVERIRAGERARLAQQLGAETERFEWMLRAAYELPLHDVSPARESVRARLAVLETQADTAGRATAGPIRYALGRGWLALDELEQADAELERAWQAGHRGPEVALARGLVLARLHERAIERARRIANPDERTAAIAEARERFEQPAIDFLERGRSVDSGRGAYIDALLAFHRLDWAAASRAAHAALEREPWLYEAQLLTGAIALAQADATNSQDEAARAEHLAAARAAFAEATRRGESDPRAYAALCSLEMGRLAATLAGSAAEAEAAYAGALAACDQALAADRTYTPARLLRLEAISGWASWAMDAGTEVTTQLAEAEQAARALVADRPEDAAARRALARLLEVRARLLRYSGDDPRPLIEEAIAALDAAAERNPDDWQTLRALGRVSAELGVQVTERGGDPLPAFDRAVHSLERSVALEPDLALLYFDLGRVLSDRAMSRTERNLDGRADYEAAAAQYQRALDLKGDYPQAWNSLGVVWYQVGIQTRRAGGDPRPELERAIGALEQAIEIRPGYANPRFNLGLVHRELATIELDAGRDPRPALERATAAFDAGLAIHSGIFFAWLEKGRVDLVGARWEVSRGRSPAADLERARASLARALADAPDDFMALRVAGEADLIEADWRHQQGRDATALLERSLDLLERARVANPADPPTTHLLGVAQELAARIR